MARQRKRIKSNSKTSNLKQKALAHAWKLAPVLYTYETPSKVVEEAVNEIKKVIRDQIEASKFKAELEIPLLAFSYASLEILPDYATLDYQHVESVQRVLRDIRYYLADPSLGRPLNFLLLASPGSGKSQLIKSIAKKLGGDRVGYVSFNMATMEAKGDFGGVLDVARNVAIDDKLPLVFLDECDSHDEHIPLLLPLLWDGELDVGHRDLRIGRSIFFLAGSRPELRTKLESAREMAAPRAFESDDSKSGAKWVDLFSRINGTVVKVPSLGDPDEDRAPDKIVIAMQLLRRRFGSCQTVPWALLKFIAKAHFRYDVRSIAMLVDLISLQGTESAATLTELTDNHLKRLPLNGIDELAASPLASHLIDMQGSDGLTKLWSRACKDRATQRLRFEPSGVSKAYTPPWIHALGKQLAPQSTRTRGTMNPRRKRT